MSDSLLDSPVDFLRDSEARCWAVVPAAGVGKRMKSSTPKQYLPLAGRTVIEQTLTRLCGHPRLSGAVVAVTQGDPYWADLGFICAQGKPVLTANGGVERGHSVLNALDTLLDVADESDWVLVHDAARPCVSRDDLDHLIQSVLKPMNSSAEGESVVGGILAVPVRDTMKRAGDEGLIAHTENREGLWHALTPQMFPLGLLRQVLGKALAQGQRVTDDASAMELAGFRPRLVEGSANNIKITRPEDLALAEFYLSQL